MIELTILNNNNYFEAYSPIDKYLVALDNGNDLNLDKYTLLPAQRLDRIEGYIYMAKIKATKYLLKEREYIINPNSYIRAVVQKGKVIPILRSAFGKERLVSNLWPIIEQ